MKPIITSTKYTEVLNYHVSDHVLFAVAKTREGGAVTTEFYLMMGGIKKIIPRQVAHSLSEIIRLVLEQEGE